MLVLILLLAQLVFSPIVVAQLLGLPLVTRASICPSAVPYTATAISRTFDYCIPAFAYAPTVTPVASPYPTNPAACANLCTGSCVAANWAGPNNCFLALGTFQSLSTFPTWNPTWTAYVVRTTSTPSFATLLGPVVTSTGIPTPVITALTPVTPTPTITTTSSQAISTSSVTPPTVVPSPASLLCPNSNGINYTDPIGTQFNIQCGFDLYNPEPELRTVQTSFQSCIDDCNRRFAGRCPGVTYVSTRQWCYIKPAEAVLRPAATNLWSAIKLPGPEGLTCPEANGTVYTDAVYTDQLRDQYQISCGVELIDSVLTRRSVQPSFQACINDCHEYDDCDAVTWRPNGEDQRWCYHKSRSAVVRRAGPNYWSAQKVYGDVLAPLSASPLLAITSATLLR